MGSNGSRAPSSGVSSDCATELTYLLGEEGSLSVGRCWAKWSSSSALDMRRIAELLGGPGFGLAAFLQGSAVLHGSCVVADGRAVSFVGSSGAGKSTMAAAVVDAGATFCSDGMTLVDPGTAICYSGPARWKLCDDSVASLNYSVAELERVSEGSRKFLVDAAEASNGTLDSVLVIDTADELRIDWFSPAEGVFQLIKYAYLVEALAETHMPMLFERMSALAQRVRVGRFTRPLSLERCGEVAEWLMNYDF
jgi:hypothetical protein